MRFVLKLFVLCVGICMLGDAAYAYGHTMAPAAEPGLLGYLLYPLQCLWFEVSHFFEHLWLTAQALLYGPGSARCDALLFDQMLHSGASYSTAFLFATPDSALFTLLVTFVIAVLLIAYMVDRLLKMLERRYGSSMAFRPF